MLKQLKGTKILIGPSSFGELDKAPLERLSDAGCNSILNPYDRRLKKEELLDLLSDDVCGLIAGLEPLSRDVLEKTKLKVISRCGSGISNIDVEAADELGIKVYSTPTAPVEAVAELTVGAMLCLLRMIPQMDKDLHENRWIKRIGLQLRGKTVAIIGFGHIGRKVAALLKPFAARIIAIDPNLQKGAIKDIPIVSLDKALAIADIITIHASGEKEIIGEKQFKLFKKGVFLLNAARGNLINEYSLLSALKNGRVKGAWLDTFSGEPYAGPLTKYSQVILTPHAGSYTSECRRNMEIEAVNNLLSGLRHNR